MSHRPGGNKRKQVYKKKVSPYLYSFQLISTQHHLYLYVIKTQLNVPLVNTNIEEKNLHPLKNECYFGLITSKPLLEIVDFPIFTPNGEETISFELINSSFYLTSNQFKIVRGFHKFLFSNVLRMDSGRGAIASQYLVNETDNNQTQTKHGYFTCIVTQDLKTKEYDINWDLMKKVEGSTDRQFLKVPNYVKVIEEVEENEEESKEAIFEFDRDKYTDSVVIPFYRTNDTNPQFYCVSSIDYASTPLSKFPLSSHSSSSQYETFYEYFALKYNILITNIVQPLLYVSHPSTRLNLLTPRYMNMKASVLQKSYTNQNRYNTQSKVANEKKTSSNKIFLVPELVNVHPFSATLWRRCLCLPSILYRLNSLLVAEELRREIAQSTGVGLPWISDQYKFDSLSFIWDANKEIEMSDIPDVEIDIATIQQQNEINVKPAQNENEVSVDPKWNFEISEWDDTCLKDASAASTANFTNKLFETLNSNASSANNIKSTTGWLIDDEINGCSNNPKTLFIDPNDMDFFGEDYIDTDEENDKLTKVQTKKTSSKKPFKPVQDFESYNSNEDDEFDEENDDELYEENVSENLTSSHKSFGQEDLKLKFTIDMNTLKADMKKKSAKLISKLSVNSNNCFLVKSLVNADTTYSINDFDEQIVETKNDFSNFDLANELASNLEDLNKNGNLGQLVFNEKNSMVQFKNNKNLIIDYDFFGDDLELNDWFTNIEFKFDSKKKQEQTKVIDKLKQQLINEVCKVILFIVGHIFFK
jgi:hypothetical protein